MLQTQMKWKYIWIDGEETYYRLYENGRIMCQLNGHWYKGVIRNGYRLMTVMWHNERRSFYLHRLMAEYWLPNPNNYKYVLFKDHNRLNASLDNLYWSEEKEQWTPAVEDGPEEWRTWRNTIFMVSSYGRMINIKLNRPIPFKGRTEMKLVVNCKTRVWNLKEILDEVWDDRLERYGEYDSEGNLIQWVTNKQATCRKPDSMIRGALERKEARERKERNKAAAEARRLAKLNNVEP